ncbi:MAG: TlpA family protein disulfide reductase [Planctomycetaceae bacterium]|jgi:thiol-disulfide isomerase/thioredoxin|nr:TlpA family protein disulfide reductase [Planctomycetaceae bacterium]
MNYNFKISFVRVNLLYVIVLFCLVTSDGCSCSHKPHEPDFPAIIEPATDPETKDNKEEDTTDNEKKITEILNRMVAVYRSARSYADHGRGMIVGKMVQPNVAPVTWTCTVAFKKDGKLRIECNEGKLVSNGTDCYAQIRSLPEQVLRFPTPHPFTFDKLFSDVELDQSMNIVFPSGIIRFPPQLILLFSPDPLKTFIPDGAKMELLESQSIGNVPCDLIKIKHDRGDRVLWISRRNSALLRFDYMVEGLLVAAEFESVRTIRIDMSDAQFDLPVAEEAFLMLQPANAKQVSEFKPVELEILGKKLTDPESLIFEELIFDIDNSSDNPPNKTTDNLPETTKNNTTNNLPKTENTNDNNKEVKNNSETSGVEAKLPLRKSIADLSGKISVFCFWTTWSEPCRLAINEFYKAADENADKKNVQFFVINSDEFNDNDNNKRVDLLRRYCVDWELRKPYLYELDDKLSDALAVDSFPTIVVIDADNRVEFYSRGGVQATTINTLLEEVEGGKKPYEKNLNELQKFLQQRKNLHTEELRLMMDKEIFASICVATEEPATSKSVKPSSPKTFTLKKNWEIPLASTGNIAVLNVKKAKNKIDEKKVDDNKSTSEIESDKKTDLPVISATKKQDGVEGIDKIDETMLLVPCDGNSVALIDSSGKLRRKVTPEGFSNDELLTLVRTIDFGGSYYIGFSSNNGNVVHVFDSNLKSRLRYVPQNKLANAKLKISDFQFVDLDGVGEPEVAVGVVAIDAKITGGDSIHAIDLNGKEIWQDNTVTTPFQIGDYNHNGQRGLYCLDAVDSVVRLQKYSAEGKKLETLSPNGTSVRCFLPDAASGDLCTIISSANGESVEIVLLNASGVIRWQKQLPAGEYNLLSADLFGKSNNEWIVFSQLGTILIFDQSGKQIDSFSLGEPITGLAVIAGQIVVATGDKVIAWQINVEKL